MPDPIKVEFRQKKETKGTIVFEEVETDEPPVVSTLYLKKYAAKRLGDPTKLIVTIEAS